jgi:hypothetical protein
MKSKAETFASTLKFEHRFEMRLVFNDFLTMSICAFGQKPGAGISYDEDLYLETIVKYKNEKLRFEFPKLLSLLIIEMTERINSTSEGWDVLGEFYEMNFASKSLSQFFTPWPICEFMARSITENVLQSSEADKKIRILDPACGSGRMLMASSRVLGTQHEYYGIDIDQTCAKIASLNLFLSGLFHSEVMWGNALAHSDFRCSYFTSILPLGLFRIKEKEKSKLWNLLDRTVPQNTKSTGNAPDVAPKKYTAGSQLKFF